MISEMLRVQVHFILCLRAKPKVKPKKKGTEGEAVRDMGYMAITGDELLFEMPLRFLLLPGANGVPSWNPTEPGERLVPRLPEQFKELFAHPQPLSEEIGQRVAEWAAGGAQPAPTVHVPTFRGRPESEWHGRPLADAPLTVLQVYAEAIAGVLKEPGDRTARTLEGLRAHAAEVDKAIGEKEPTEGNFEIP